MNITFILNNPGLGGAEKQLLLLAENIQAQHNVTIIFLSCSNNYNNKFDSAKVNKVFLNYKKQFISFNTIKTYLLLSKTLKASNPDIIHAWLFNSNLFGILFKVFNRNKIVIISERGTQHWFHLKHKLFSRFFYRYADAVVLNSLQNKEYINQKYKCSDKSVYIPNGISIPKNSFELSLTERFCKKLKGKFIVCCVGRFTVEKRYIDIIKSIKILTESKANVHFLLVGGKGNIEECKKLAAETGVADFITFTGEVNNPLDYISLSHVFLTASFSEGMPNSVMEAMSLGKPIVATAAGAIPELVKHNVNGLIIPMYNPHKIAQNIKLLMNNLELCEQYGKKSLEIIESFSVRNMVSEHLSLYSKFNLHDKSLCLNQSA